MTGELRDVQAIRADLVAWNGATTDLAVVGEAGLRLAADVEPLLAALAERDAKIAALPQMIRDWPFQQTEPGQGGHCWQTHEREDFARWIEQHFVTTSTRSVGSMTDERDVQGDIAYVRACLRTEGSRQMLDRITADLAERDAKLAAVLSECERADDTMRRQYAERNGYGAVPNALEVAALSRLATAKVRELALEPALSLSVPTSPQTEEQQ